MSFSVYGVCVFGRESARDLLGGMLVLYVASCHRGIDLCRILSLITTPKFICSGMKMLLRVPHGSS